MTGFFRQIVLLILLLVLGACSTPEGNLRKAEKPQQPVHERQVSAMQKKVTYFLEKKQYRQALETMTRRREPNLSPSGMEKEFVAAVNGLLETGEEAMARNEHLAAGQLFKLALATYPAEPSLRRKVKPSARRVKIYLDSCSAKLMDEGMQEYRRGELDPAIRTWKSILSFDPGHREALKAIETATVQKKSLQVLEE
ncbi:hypothetical protein [Geotalea sp. SG265]|uniref:hypothetical protein n=1 Tax=Geotalea sp. SG265 TaxID=2922867 RepID=UPI001FB02551|nr:hypothetical protein [Geotalea sp. SG265]